MNKFTQRTTIPKNNKFYITKSKGGLNGAIQGSPVVSGANVLANCVGYANGRFNEIISEIRGEEQFPYQLTSDAGAFIKYGVPMGLKVSQTPEPGSIMVWDVNGPGGHVCVVEEVLAKDRVKISQSNYQGTAFEYKTRTNANGRWGMNGKFTFLGFLLNPAVTEEQDTSNDTEPAEEYDIYIVQSGDTMYKIAASYHISLSELEEMNPQIENPNLIYPGQKIYVPKSNAAAKPVTEKFAIGDKVILKEDAVVYGTNIRFSSWVYHVKLFVRAISKNRITVSTNQNGAVTGNVDKKYLKKA